MLWQKEPISGHCMWPLRLPPPSLPRLVWTLRLSPPPGITFSASPPLSPLCSGCQCWEGWGAETPQFFPDAYLRSVTSETFLEGPPRFSSSPWAAPELPLTSPCSVSPSFRAGAQRLLYRSLILSLQVRPPLPHPQMSSPCSEPTCHNNSTEYQSRTWQFTEALSLTCIFPVTLTTTL